MPGRPVNALLSGQFPRNPNTAIGADPWTLWLGPREWLIYSVEQTLDNIEEILADDVAAGALLCTDTSSGLALLELAGPGACEALSAGCGLDFEGDAVGAGACAQTQFFHVPLIIHRPDAAPLWRLLVDRSLARWTRDALSGS
jgi:heterotetrameric sarcosine oxidase gamma subunit